MRLGQVDRWMQFEEPDATGGGGGADQAAGGRDASYWETEAKRAFKDRDTVKQKLRDLEGRVLSDEDRKLFESLKEQQAKADELRKRKEGEFDSWRTDILKKHDGELQTEREARTAAEAKYRQKLIGLEFAAASSLFGESGKTVLTPDIAEAYFGKFVDIQTDDQGVERVVVKGADGHVVLNAKTGHPAAFVDAMDDLIATLPHRDRILRGSGKTGSGSPGGTKQGPGVPPDLKELTQRAATGDKEAVAALKSRRRQSGGIVFGEAFSR